MNHSIPERRVMRRMDMRLPALVKLAPGDGNQISTETHNVSARGLYFCLDRRLQPGDNIDVTLTFPPHVTLIQKVRVRFNARVVRVDEERWVGAGFGIGAAIDSYEFLRDYPLEVMEKSKEPGWNQ